MLDISVAEPDTRFTDEKLVVAQRAIKLPEVQDMLRRLSEFNLGVFMPHVHDENGMFQSSPDGTISVEDGLEVSFHQEASLEKKADNLVPVAWVWRDDGVFVGAGCKEVCIDMPTGQPGPRPHRKTHNQGY